MLAGNESDLGSLISSSGIRNRILDIGKQLDADIERDIAKRYLKPLQKCRFAKKSPRETSNFSMRKFGAKWIALIYIQCFEDSISL